MVWTLIEDIISSKVYFLFHSSAAGHLKTATSTTWNNGRHQHFPGHCHGADGDLRRHERCQERKLFQQQSRSVECWQPTLSGPLGCITIYKTSTSYEILMILSFKLTLSGKVSTTFLATVAFNLRYSRKERNALANSLGCMANVYVYLPLVYAA